MTGIAVDVTLVTVGLTADVTVVTECVTVVLGDLGGSLLDSGGKVLRTDVGTVLRTGGSASLVVISSLLSFVVAGMTIGAITGVCMVLVGATGAMIANTGDPVLLSVCMFIVGPAIKQWKSSKLRNTIPSIKYTS